MDSTYLEAERRHTLIEQERVQNFVKGIVMAPAIIAGPVVFIWILSKVLG
jgi:hypothetical protein